MENTLLHVGRSTKTALQELAPNEPGAPKWQALARQVLENFVQMKRAQAVLYTIHEPHPAQENAFAGKTAHPVGSDNPVCEER